MRNSRILEGESIPIPTNKAFCCKYSCESRSKVGISSTQGGHQEAQKFTTTTFSCHSDVLAGFPSGVCQGLAKKAFTEGSLARPVFEIHCEVSTPPSSAKRLIPQMVSNCLRFIATPSLKFVDAYTYLGHLRHFHGRHCRNRSASRTSCNWL